MDLAAVSLGTPRSWAPYSLVEIAQFANLVQPEGASPVNEFTFAVIAIRYHIA